MDPNQLPIDIHLAKLLGTFLNRFFIQFMFLFKFFFFYSLISKNKDWILDRRQCPRDWQKGVVPIRNKINLAIQDMPEHDEITSLLSGSGTFYSHYFFAQTQANYF
jgi:hypothetical protein